jgi:quinol monooxygenase YgiN
MNPPKIEVEGEISAIVAKFGAELNDPAKPLSLLVRFQVSEGAEQAVEAAFAEAATQTRKENGVIAFDLNREASDGTCFIVYERWKSLADLEAHLRTPYVTALREELKSLIIGTPEFRVLTPARA